MATNAISYIKNVGKSLGYVTKEVLKDNNPTLVSLGKQAKDATSSIYNSIKDFSYKASQATDSEKSLFGVGKDVVKSLGKNLFDDLKTGNWYNQQRHDAATNELMKSMGFDLDFDMDFGDDFGDDNLGFDDDTEAEMSNDNRNTQASILAMDATGAKIAGAVGEATVKSADYIVESSRQMNQAMYDLNSRGFRSIQEALADMNRTNAGFMEAIGKPLTDHMQNSTKFFVSVESRLDKIQTTLDQIAKNTTPAADLQKYKSISAKKGMRDVIGIDGSLDFGALADIAKASIKEYTSLLSMFKGAGDGKGLKSAIAAAKNASPMSWITTFLVSSALPTALKEAMKGLNTGISDFFAGGLSKIIHSNKGGFLGSLLRSLLPKDELNTRLNPAKYNKGPVQWDGIARKALVEVIPTTLFKIYSAITGTPEMVFDYMTGKFIKVKNLSKKMKEEQRQAALRAGGDFRDNIRNRYKNNSKMQADVDKYFEYAFNNADFDRINDPDFRKQLAKKLKIDPAALDMIASMSLDRKSGSSRYHGARLSGRAALNRQYREMEEAGISPYLSLENDSKLMQKNNRIRDKFNHDSLFYLRGIWLNTGGKENNKSQSNGGENTTAKSNKKRKKKNKKNDNMVSNVFTQAEEEDTKGLIVRRAEEFGEESGGKIREFLLNHLPQPVVDFFAKPINAITEFFNKTSDAINDFLWGQDGFFNSMKKRMNEYFDPYKEKIKNWAKEKLQPFWEATKGELRNVGGSLRDTAGTIVYGSEGYRLRKARRANEDVSEDEMGAISDVIGNARGTKHIKKTGIYALSRGELVIPSEFNPFFHGITNKRDQIRKEKAAIDRYYGYSGRRVHTSGRSYHGVRMAAGGERAAGSDDAAAGGGISEEESIVALGLAGLAKKGVSNITDWFSNFFGDAKKDANAIKDTLANSSFGKLTKEQQGGIGAGALIGAGASALTGLIGGPLLGAATGAAVGFITKSEAAQKMLFGDIDEETGEREGGFFSKEFSNFAAKQLPGMGKGAALGAGAGLFLGSPILGAIAGSTIGFVANSDRAKEFLFGNMGENNEWKEGVIPKELQDRFKKAAPNMTAGALAGLALGPFGLFGNIVAGAGVGFLSTNEKVHEYFFGKGDENGKNKGLLPRIQEKILGNITEIFANIGNRLKFIGKNLLNHAKDTITNIGKKLSDRLKKASEKNTLGGRLLGAIGNIGKGLVSGPGAILGGISKSIKRGNLRKGYDVFDKRKGRNLTASERISLRKEVGNGVHFIQGAGTSFNKFDEILAGVETENEMNEISKFLEMASGKGKDSEGARNILKDKYGIKFDRTDAKKALDLTKSEKGRRFKTASEKSLENIETGLRKLIVKICGGTVENALKNEDNIESTRESTVDFLGNVRQYLRKPDGTLEPVKDDAGTDAAAKEMSGFKGAIMSIPKKLGDFGKSLFGSNDDKEDKKETLLDKIRNFLFGDSKFSLKSLVSVTLSGILPVAFGITALSGKFDKIAEKLGLGGDPDEQEKLTGADSGRKVVYDTATKKYVYADTGEEVTGENIKSAVGDKKTFSGNLKSGLGKAAITASAGLLTHGGKAIGKVASKFLSKNGTVLAGAALKNSLKTGAKEAGEGLGKYIVKMFKKVPILRKISTSVAEKFGKALQETAENAVKRSGAKTAAAGFKQAASATVIAGVVLAVAQFAAEFTAGYQDANATFHILSTPTTGQKVISGLMRGLKAAVGYIPVIGLPLELGLSLIPDSKIVDLIVDILGPALGLDFGDLNAQREEADQIVKEYNDQKRAEAEAKGETWKDLTFDQYNKQVAKNYTWTEKLKNGFNSTVASIKANGLKDTLKTGFSNFGTKLKESKFGQTVGKIGAKIDSTFGINDLWNLAKEGKFKEFILYNEGINEEDDNTNPAMKFIKAIPTRITKYAMLPIVMVTSAGRKIKETFDKITNKIKATSDYIKSNYEEADNILHTKNSDYKDFLKLSEPDPENPVGGLAKGIALVGRISTIPIGLVKMLGNKISEKYNEIKDAITADIKAIGDLLNASKSFSDTGDITGLWSNKIERKSDSPISGITHALFGVGSKLFWTIPTLFNKIGNDISSKFTSISESFKKDAETYETAKDKIDYAVNSKSATISDILSVDTKVFSKDGVGLMFAGVTKVHQGIAVIKKLFKYVFDFIGDIWSGAKDKAGDILDNVKNFWSNTKDKIDDSFIGKIASNIYSKTNELFSGSGSGFISQNDPAYRNYNVGGSSFSNKGCGPAVASMAASAMGRNLSVQDAYNMSKAYQNQNGVSYDYFSKALGSRGIHTRYMSNSSAIANNLLSGGSTILLGKDPTNRSKANSPFGPRGHYVLARGFDRNGNVIINDPEMNGPTAYNPSILKSAILGISGGDSALSDNAPSYARAAVAQASTINPEVKSSNVNSALDTATARNIWAYYKSQGLSNEATAAIMGNLYSESKFNTTNHSGDSGKAAGIAQWHNYSNAEGRWKNLYEYAKGRGKSWTDLETQLSFILHEAKGSRSKNFGFKYNDWGVKGNGTDAFLNSNDLEYATKLFAAAFEAPKYTEKGKNGRIQNAVDFYNLYSGSTFKFDPSISSSVGEDSSYSSEENSDDTKITFSNILSSISSMFGNIFGGLTGKGSSKGSGIVDPYLTNDEDLISSTENGNLSYLNLTGSAKEKQKALVSVMGSKLGKLRYSLDGKEQDPDKGVASCASTVGWTYKKVLGDNFAKNQMSASSTAQSKDPRFTTIYSNNGTNLLDYSKLLPGDILYDNWEQTVNNGEMQHTEMYAGNGKVLSHGGPGNGPTYKDLNNYRLKHLMMVRRYNGFINNSSENDMQNAPSYARAAAANAMTGSGSGLVAPRLYASGGATGLTSMANKSSMMLTDMASSIKASAANGQISGELLQQLIMAIIEVLKSIANNTAPVGQIYTTLQNYAANNSVATTNTNTSGISNSTMTGTTSSDISENFKNIVGQLASIAKG